MTTTSYHISRLGSYGAGIPTDRDGCVHLTAEGWLACPDGIEERDRAERETPDDADDYLAEWAERMADEARRRTEDAEQALAERDGWSTDTSAIPTIDQLRQLATEAEASYGDWTGYAWLLAARWPALGEWTRLHAEAAEEGGTGLLAEDWAEAAVRDAAHLIALGIVTADEAAARWAIEFGA